MASLAAWDVHRAKLFGRRERKNGIAAFERLVAQVMNQELYRSASRVFFIAEARLVPSRAAGGCPTASHVAKCRSGSHTNSCQASDFDHRSALKRGLIAFQRRYQRSAKPFKWTFTRRDLRVVLVKLMSHNVTPHKNIRPGIRHRNSP